MKNFARPLVAVAAAVMALAPAMAQAQSAPSFTTVRPNQITAAYRTDDKPVSFIDDKGNPTGFVVDFMNAIGKELGLKVEYIATDFASMVPGVRNKLYDTAAFQVLATDARKKVVSFTEPVGFAQARLVSRKDAAITKIDGANNKTVAITRGSALIPKLEKLAPKVTVREFPNIAASLNALLAGQVDGLFTGLNTAEHLAQQHSELTLSQMVTTGETAFPIAPDNPGMVKAMNAAITKLMKNGTYTRLFAKWNPPTVAIPEQLFSAYPGMPHRSE